jgi:divalent metal cation (Fe/Co/Zn/Cd) transporter
VNILRTGFQLVQRSYDGLMDRALPKAEDEQLRATIRAALPPSTTFHLLRTRQAGRRVFADFHLLVPGAHTVKQGHHLAHRVEEAITAVLPDLELTIHLEPIEEMSSWETNTLQQLGEATTPVPARLPDEPTPSNL